MNDSVPVETERDLTVADWLAMATIAVVVIVVASVIRTDEVGWGDDFALYLLQAKAIAAGSLNAEVMLNSHVLALSDAPVGPPAAPWGFPVLLWLAAKFVGWQINALKVVGIVSLGLFAGSAYALARNYLSRLGSAAAALFIALQPLILASTEELTSDVPFLAACGIALVVGERFVRYRPDRARFRPSLILCASLLTTIAFSIRSNGAFLAVAFCSVLACSAFTASTTRRLHLLTELLLFAVTTAVLFVVYFRAFPDGSLYHAQLLTLAPDVLVRRSSEVVASTAEFVPFSIMRRFGLLGPVPSALLGGVGVTLFVVGAWRYRERSAGLVVFALLNLALLVVFPANGGARYLFPVLIPAVMLCAAGAAFAIRRLLEAPWGAQYAARVAAAENVALVAAIAAMFAIVPLAFRDRQRAAPSGPLTPVADSLFTFVRTRVPPGKTVSFFKARALRLFTGRLGIAITKAENLSRADYVVLDKSAEDGRWQLFWQLDRRTVEAYDNGRFKKIYENGQFLMYGTQQPDVTIPNDR